MRQHRKCKHHSKKQPEEAVANHAFHRVTPPLLRCAGSPDCATATRE
jgi:hypothetical protein